MRGFEPRTSRMQSARSTTELHPLRWRDVEKINYINYITVGLRDGCSIKQKKIIDLISYPMNDDSLLWN